MTIGECVYSMSDPILCHYIEEVASALEPDDLELQRGLCAGAWCRLSQEQGDADKRYLLRQGLDAMLRRTAVSRNGVRRVKYVTAKYISILSSETAPDMV